MDSGQKEVKFVDKPVNSRSNWLGHARSVSCALIGFVVVCLKKPFCASHLIFRQTVNSLRETAKRSSRQMKLQSRNWWRQATDHNFQLVWMNRIGDCNLRWTKQATHLTGCGQINAGYWSVCLQISPLHAQCPFQITGNLEAVSVAGQSALFYGAKKTQCQVYTLPAFPLLVQGCCVGPATTILLVEQSSSCATKH